MKDIVYILKNAFVSFVLVSLAFIIDMAGYYRIDHMQSARRLFTGDIYTLTYYGIMILFMIVLYELWKTIMDPFEEYILYQLIFCIVLAIVLLFLPIVSLFKVLGFLFMLFLSLRCGYFMIKKNKS